MKKLLLTLNDFYFSVPQLSAISFVYSNSAKYIYASYVFHYFPWPDVATPLIEDY